VTRTIIPGCRRRAVAAVLAMAAALTAAGCGSDEPDPPASTVRPTTSASPTGTAGASASASASALVEFTVDGAGPYLLGADLTDLRPRLGGVATGGKTCPANTTATGTGTWTGVQVSFRPDGKLYLLVNRSASIPTPSGAWLGTTLADLKKIYAGVPGQELKQGTRTAYLVTTLSGRGILFDLGDTGAVTAMMAGEAAFLRTSYQGGTDFC
jgi:hypothetical protein